MEISNSSGKLHPYWLDFIVLEGAMQATREEKWSPVLPSCEEEKLSLDESVQEISLFVIVVIMTLYF